MNIDNVSRSELERLIDEWILSERNRKMMKRRYLDGICYEPLAEEFDLSVRQTKRIIAEGYNVLMAHI